MPGNTLQFYCGKEFILLLSLFFFFLSVLNDWLYLIVIPSLYIEERNSFCKILTVFCNTFEELSYGLHLLSLLVPDICSVKKKNDVLFCKTIPRVFPLAKLTIHYVREKNLQNVSGKVEQTIAVDCDSTEYTYKCKCWYQEYSLSSLKCFH